MRLEFKSVSIPSATLVADEFIDHEMAHANGEYVKIYLYLLRHAGEDVDGESIADALDLVLADVDRAIAYWKRVGMISEVIAQSEEKKLPQREESTQTVQIAKSDDAVVENVVEMRPKMDMRKLASDTNLEELNYMIQRYLGVTFNSMDTEMVAYLYDNLHMSAELLGYLADYCATNKKKSLRYFEKVALDWHKKGVKTIEEAKQIGVQYNSEIYSVMREFGKNRLVTPTEETLISKWYHEYGFPQDIIVEACRRTVIKSGEPRFDYADSILTDWHNKGLKTWDDIKLDDKKHDERSNAASNKVAVKSSATHNKFHNLEERDDDIDEAAFEKTQEMLKKYN